MEDRDSIGYWRKKIDKINLDVLKLLNERVEAACEIGKIKKKSGMDISDSNRERLIIENLLKENSGILDDVAVKKIFSVIIEENKRIESGV